MTPTRIALFASILCVCLSTGAGAQQTGSLADPAAARGALHGTATTQGRTIRLPGVTVTVSDQAGSVVATTVTEGDGSYRASALPPGQLTVTFSLEGFESVRSIVQVTARGDVEANGDLEIARVTEHLEVVQQAYAEPMAMTLGSREVLDEKTMQSSSFAGGSIDAALSMLAGVVFGPEGLSIRGGRPGQSIMLLGGADMADAAVGTARYQLPSEAVSTVEVLPNPYAVEFGRFSSGVTIVNTRRGTDRWQAAVNNLEPGLRFKRGHFGDVTGIKVFAPHASLGGPLIKDRLFLAQTNHFDYRSSDIQSRPDDQRTSQTQWSSFTRLDANVGPGHTATLTFGVFPEKRRAANLDTFTPPESTFDLSQSVYSVGVADSKTLSSNSIFETSAQVSRYEVQVDGHGGSGDMVIQPGGVTGRFFNNQGRTTNAVQWVASLSDFRHWGGEHLLKAGVDVLHSEYDGHSSSLPVQIRRDDGTLARLIQFGPSSGIQVGATDLGLFLQDRWRPAPRLLFELGGRLDRDGTIDRVNLTPRTGVALLLKADGSVTLKGGAGLFYERTPLVVGAFDQLEGRTETLYAADGTTPLDASVHFVNRTDGTLDTPASTTWNVEYDHRLNPSWSFRVSHLQRRGVHELIVNPAVDGTQGFLTISSAGRSDYRETEVSGRYASGADFEISLSYLRSHSAADLNNYVAFFGADRNPVIDANEYGPTPSDVPNRIVARMRAMIGRRWSFASFAELRNGFPYSAVNALQDYVGPRNQAGRFPPVALVNVALERQIKFWKWTPWIGVKVANALNDFVPLDVQRNLDSRDYGSFYNSIPRQVRLTLRIN